MYIRVRGKIFGPFDDKQLLAMKVQGKLGKTTDISEDRIEWKSAGDMESLYPKTIPLAQDAPASATPVEESPAENTAGVQVPFTAQTPPIYIAEPVGSSPATAKQTPLGLIIGLVSGGVGVLCLLGFLMMFLFTSPDGSSVAKNDTETTTYDHTQDALPPAETEPEKEKPKRTVVEIEDMPLNNGREFKNRFGDKYAGDLADLIFKDYREFSGECNKKCKNFVQDYENKDMVQNITALHQIFDSIMMKISKEWITAIENSSVLPKFSEAVAIFELELENNKVLSNLEKCMTLIQEDLKSVDKKEKENTLKLYSILSQYQTAVSDSAGSYETYTKSRLSYKDEFAKISALAKLEW